MWQRQVSDPVFCVNEGGPYSCLRLVETDTVAQLAFGVYDGAMALYLTTMGLKGVSSTKLQPGSGRDTREGGHLTMRIRETFEDEGVAFWRPVEVDETHMGDGGYRERRIASKGEPVTQSRSEMF